MQVHIQRIHRNFRHSCVTAFLPQIADTVCCIFSLTFRQKLLDVVYQ